MSATNIKKTWFSSNIKETPSCVCRQYWWENFQANQTSSRSHALLMVSPQTNSSDIKNKYGADINIYVEPIWYIETSNTWNNAMMEHTDIYRFLDGNPRSDKSKDNWIQGWISLVWEKNRIAKWYCSHKSPVIIKLQKKPQKFKQECWQILYLRDQGTLQRNCSRWTFVRQQSRERKQKERWSTEGLIHTFQSFFPFCFLFIFWSTGLLVCFPSYCHVDVQFVFWR